MRQEAIEMEKLKKLEEEEKARLELLESQKSLINESQTVESASADDARERNETAEHTTEEPAETLVESQQQIRIEDPKIGKIEEVSTKTRSLSQDGHELIGSVKVLFILPITPKAFHNDEFSD